MNVRERQIRRLITDMKVKQTFLRNQYIILDFRITSLEQRLNHLKEHGGI